MWPIKNKLTFIISYGDNAKAILDSIRRLEHNQSIVLLFNRPSKQEWQPYKTGKVESSSLLDCIKSAYHLSTSRKIVVDNYVGILSQMKLKPGVECIQVWHSVGAIKRFGLLADTTHTRGELALKRFKAVYRNFTKIIVASDKMADVFAGAFGATKDRFLPLGIPRTDLFFKTDQIAKIKQDFYNDYPELTSKKLILYAPTFREKEVKQFQFKLDVSLMAKQLGEDYALLIKLHPAIPFPDEVGRAVEGFAYDLSQHKNVNHLLVLADLVVTDYSSIIFEAALLKKPYLLYAYDKHEYEQTPGFIAPLETLTISPLARTTDDVIRQIQLQAFDEGRLKQIATEWNTYSDGSASLRVARYLTQN
jgi:CDP-glycerol glycerophosphotransferase (TagB/SpsB family)